MAIDEQWIESQLEQLQATPPAIMPTGTPDDGTPRSWTGLLGEVFSGGQGPGYRLRGREADTAGNRALLNFGINMLLASGPQRVKPDLLSAAATGLQGAQQSIGVDQQRAKEEAQGQTQLLSEQQKRQIERLRTAIPLLKAKQEMDDARRAANAPPPWGAPPPGGAPGPGAAAPAVTPFVAQNLPAGVTPALDQVVRTVIGEAEGETPVGQQAVAAVIRNRMAGGRSASDVIFQPGAFEPWVNPARRRRMEEISPSDPLYQRVLATVRPVLEGAAPDPTGGATHFYSPTAQKALGREMPAWGAGTPTAVIGRHRFYAPDGRPAPPAGPAATRPPPGVPAPDVPPAGAQPASAQVAGPPGAAVPGPARPPSSEVAGNVQAIVQGMTQPGGADPATLAPGAGRPVPGVQVAAVGAPSDTPPATPPAPGEDEDFDAYRAKRPVRFSPEQEAQFRGVPDPTVMGIHGARQQAAEAAWMQARSIRDPTERARVQAAALAERDAARTAQAAAIAEAGEKGRAARAAATEAEITRQHKDFEALRNSRRDAAKEERQHRQALDLENLRAGNKRQENVDTAVTGAASERVKDLQGRASVAQRMIRNVEALEAFAPAMGDPNALVASNPQLRDWLITLGLPGLAGGTMGELRASQVWDRLVTSFGADVKVPGSGSTSDKEGEWMMSQFGGPEQTVEDRMTQLAVLRKLAQNRIADHTDAADMFQNQNGKLSGLDKKISERAKLFDRPMANGKPLEWKPDDPANKAEHIKYALRHPRGEPYAAYAADGTLRYYRNEMGTDANGKPRLVVKPLLGGSMVAE